MKKPKKDQTKVNHYKYMIQKVKSPKAKVEKGNFQDCLPKWDEFEDKEEKLTTPISVLAHYKKYTVEERKIFLQKLDRENATLRISYDGPKDEKKIYLVNPREDLNQCTWPLN